MSIVNLLSSQWDEKGEKSTIKKTRRKTKTKYLYKNMSLGFRELLKFVLQVLSSYNNLYIS